MPEAPALSASAARARAEQQAAEQAAEQAKQNPLEVRHAFAVLGVESGDIYTGPLDFIEEALASDEVHGILRPPSSDEVYMAARFLSEGYFTEADEAGFQSDRWQAEESPVLYYFIVFVTNEGEVIMTSDSDVLIAPSRTTNTMERMATGAVMMKDIAGRETASLTVQQVIQAQYNIGRQLQQAQEAQRLQAQLAKEKAEADG